MRFLPLLPILLLAISGCCLHAGAPERPQPVVAGYSQDVEVDSERGRIRITELTRGLENPWSLALLPDGNMLVSERPGRLLKLDAKGNLLAQIEGLPTIFVDGQAGLLDVVPAPDFASSKLVYLCFAKPNLRGNLAGTAVFRARLEGNALVDGKVIYEQEPKLSSGTHVGSRLVFDGRGHLFVTQGENNKRPSAQDLD